jgi:hypothetical protein
VARRRQAARLLEHGSTGSDTAYTLACEVLDRDDFNRRHRSLLRAHDGAGGDPRRATRFLDRPPTDDETNATLRVLCQLDVRCAQPAAAGQHARTVKVSPHLLRRADGAVPDYTAHSLKQWKIDLYQALLLHTDFIVEPGAHAGSQLERMSVAGATDQARQIRPTGLSVALRYARATASGCVREASRTQTPPNGTGRHGRRWSFRHERLSKKPASRATRRARQPLRTLAETSQHSNGCSSALRPKPHEARYGGSCSSNPCRSTRQYQSLTQLHREAATAPP